MMAGQMPLMVALVSKLPLPSAYCAGYERFDRLRAVRDVMVESTRPTNRGGPAARQGFKYQDHVAAGLILRMLRDSSYSRIECETADDIVAVFQVAGETVYEYIQVKTTEGDGKWNWMEATKLEDGKPNSSLFHKSLKCDKHPGVARFRVVSKRDVASILEAFKIELDKRSLPDKTTERATALHKKFKTAISPQKRNFVYWAENFVWQVNGDLDALKALNLQALWKLAEDNGTRVSFSQLQTIYEEFLELADMAATADVITESDKKIIVREAALALLKQRFAEADANAAATAKPYKTRPDPFLVEFHAATEAGLLRSISGFDVKYSLKEWRCDGLAKHLIEWLPEFSLKASEIVNLQSHNAQTLLARSVGSFNDTDLPRDRLIAELILHAILRIEEDSEPVACKVFYRKGGKLSAFGNAHIIQNPGHGDQLWLGLSRLIEAGQMDTTLQQICETLDATISEAVLAAEREIVVALREPHHHQPKAEAFNRALHRNSTVDEMLEVLCFPVLLTYDSEALSSGWLATYVNNLKTEIIAHYGRLISQLPMNIEQIKVAIFLVPMESVAKLVNAFNVQCGKLEDLNAGLKVS